MMLAASPCVAAAALINWDMLADRLDRARDGLLVRTPAGAGRGHAWARRMAAKLYPALLLGPLFLLCLRAGGWRDFS